MGKDEMQITPNHRKIRARHRLLKLIKGPPEIEAWLKLDYTEQDIDGGLRRPENGKASGGDVIHGEA